MRPEFTLGSGADKSASRIGAAVPSILAEYHIKFRHALSSVNQHFQREFSCSITHDVLHKKPHVENRSWNVPFTHLIAMIF